MSEKPKPWRVRVLREAEDWVEVLAHSKEEAERLALERPGVKGVRGVTIKGDKRADAPRAAVVEEDDEDR